METTKDGCNDVEIRITLKIKVRKIESKISVDVTERKVEVHECNLMKTRCFSCVPFCEAIVAAKDYAFRRREPKAIVTVVNSNN